MYRELLWEVLYQRSMLRTGLGNIFFEVAFFNRRTIFGAFLRVRSCSQTRKTLHPAALSVLPTTLSRATFLASLATQNARLFTGRLECCGHPCQKQPSTKTASLFDRNIKSGFPNKLELRRQPVILLARIRRMSAISVFLFPLPFIRDITCDLFATSKTSLIPQDFVIRTVRTLCFQPWPHTQQSFPLNVIMAAGLLNQGYQPS